MSGRRLPFGALGLAALLTGMPSAARAQAPAPADAHPPAHGAPADRGAGRTTPAAPEPPAPDDEHAGHQAPAPVSLPPFIPPITDADRAVAFPDVGGHAVHDDVVNYFVLLDQLEGQAGRGDEGFSWDATGWVGKDRDRFWFRTEGSHTAAGDFEEGQLDLLYGRQISRWWDVVAGVRQDVEPGPAQTWAAVGVQGLAPYWFEVGATAYVGASGRTHLRLEVEYDLLLTNRLILQPILEGEIYGKADPERGLDAGLTTGEAGLRLRYLVRREIAPYVGVVWSRKFFGTADLARAQGDRTATARVAFGLRLWL